MDAIIIGGGIGGLSASIGLGHAGIRAHVYERAPKIEEIGAGLSLWANGAKALGYLGVGDELAAATTPLEVVGTRTASNAALGLVDVRSVHDNVGAQSVAMHRGELLQILVNACDPDTIHADKEVRHVEQKSDRVIAHFSDGDRASADVLVAADGVLSPVRRQLVPEAAPAYAGYSTYRSVLDDFEPGVGWPRRAMIRTLSCGEYFGAGEIGPRRYLWFLTKNGRLDEPEPDGRKAAVTSLVSSWAAPVRSFVEVTPEDDILLHPVYKLRPLRTWRFGRVVLLGDAAHPIEPALGMGASLAIEDAVVLARSLQQDPDPDRAFRIYEDRRMPRVRKLVRWSRMLARSEQMANLVTCRMRDLATRLGPAGLTRFLARRAFDFTP